MISFTKRKQIEIELVARPAADQTKEPRTVSHAQTIPQLLLVGPHFLQHVKVLLLFLHYIGLAILQQCSQIFHGAMNTIKRNSPIFTLMEISRRALLH